MLENLPTEGIVFWPVGNGDSVTVCVDDDTVIEIDINHLDEADSDETATTPMVDRLIELLPQRDGSPHLSLFVLTHPDQDHCRGFERLLDEVHIGEIWFAPRIFREYTQDLCRDAKAFRTEAKRRVAEAISNGGELVSGDRVRVIGYSDLLDEDEYKGYPSELLTIPGESITEIDGKDRAEQFRAFVHAPFKDDDSGDRNDTSVGLQVTLREDDREGKAILLGDLKYPVVSRIFDQSDDEDLEWDVFLAPHHCSKSVMYWKDEGADSESLKSELLKQIETAGGDEGYIVASSRPIPSSNEPGDNPPHRKAANRYSEIAPTGFLCTQEHPNETSPEPIVFELGANGGLVKSDDVEQEAAEEKSSRSRLGAAVAAARGSEAPPTDQIGFGLRE